MSIDRAGLAEAVARHGAVVRVVVAATAGSAPREAGAAMIVWPEGQAGTIGGGALEWEAAAEARAMLAGDAGPVRLRRMPLGPGLGQCCGGAVTLVWERWDAVMLESLPLEGPHVRRVDPAAGAAPLSIRRAGAEGRDARAPARRMFDRGWLVEHVAPARRPVWVWGAGHVGRAIVSVMAPLPGVAITWLDTAPDRFPAPPHGVTVLADAALPDLVARAPNAAHHLVLTYSHALDLELCHRLLRHGFASCGLIGSQTKRARFDRRLQALDHAPEAIARIVCPIGDPSLGKHPQAIAIGVAAGFLVAGKTTAASAPLRERRA
jgi:xanthine dehydrogenase accessory factor